MPTPEQIAAAKDSYFENADYAEVGSIEKAKAFATACRRLIQVTPKRAAHGNRSQEIETDLVVLQQELVACNRWIAVNGGSVAGTATYYSFNHFSR